MTGSTQDDYVVREVPVFLCKTLEDKLHIFRFPYQKKAYGNTKKNICSGRIKCNSNVIELDCALNTSSEFYDTEKGEDLASNNQSSSSDNTKNDNKSNLLNKFTIKGDWCINSDDMERYLLMTLFEGKVYLNFINGCYQFLPSHNHLSNKCKKSKEKRKGDTSENEDSQEEDKSAVPVTVQFSQKKLITKKSLREVEEESFRDYFSNLEQEPWLDLKYFNINSPYTMRITDKLCHAMNRDRRYAFQLTPKQFANIMFPKYTGEGTLSAKFDAHCITDEKEIIVDDIKPKITSNPESKPKKKSKK